MKSRRKIVKSLVFVGLVLVFALSLANQLEAGDKYLRGEYAVVGETTCVSHWLVNPSYPNSDIYPYWTNTSSTQGTITFNGDGTGSGEVLWVERTHPIYTPIPNGNLPFFASYWPNPLGHLGQTSTDIISFQFTYTVVSANGAITRTQTPGTVKGTVITGPLAGQTFESTPVTLTGFVSRDNGTIVSSTPLDPPEIVTTTFSGGNIVEQECHRSRVLILISK